MEKITVTSPLLPPLEEYIPYLQRIWDSKWITNNGTFHEQLETALADYLKVPFISLFTNGTLPLIVGLQALGIRQGEVITTPYSFVATSHAIWWNGLTPVFVDVDPETGNINSELIESAITSRTVAILPVHVYGTPCDTERIQAVADKHGLKVIYDSAHAFGVERNGRSILMEGDLSTLSFHATKTYTTIEGGAVVCHDYEMKKKIDYLKNFGFEDETEVVGPGINGKMDEVRAAFGLLNLKYVDKAIAIRKTMTERYRQGLKETEGVSFFDELIGVKYNYSYFPVFIDENTYGQSRDELYFRLKEKGILGRRYFYPLISCFSPYNSCPSSHPSDLPVASKMADSVICLPMHHLLKENEVDKVIEILRR